MSSDSQIPWKRITAEGVVIVVSILFAFSIDAWWEERQEQDAEIKQLVRVSAELKANSDRIQRKLETLSVAIDATSEFVSWMGPQPEPVQPKHYFDLWNKLYSIGTFALLRSASEDYLAAGQIDTAQSAEVRHTISERYTYGDDLEKQYGLLRVAHANVGDYSQDIVPALREMRFTPVMEGHPTSKFPYDQGMVLSDPKMESRLAIYLVRMEFGHLQALELQDRQAKLQTLIESATM